MKKLLMLALLCVGIGAPAYADKAVKDAAGTNFNLCTTTVSTTEVPCHQVEDTTGTRIDPATKQNQATANGSLASIDAKTGLAIPAGESHIGEVGGRLVIASCSSTPCFTTSTNVTAISGGYQIANSTTAASVTVFTFNVCRVSNGTGMIRRGRIWVASDTGFAGKAVLLKLYNALPTVAAGDHATWSTSMSGFIGSLYIPLSEHFTDAEFGVGAPTQGNEIAFTCVGTNPLYGLLVAADPFTPQAASKAVNGALEVVLN